MSAASEAERDSVRIDDEASDWIVVQSERDLTPDEEKAFSDWLAADPRHKKAHESLGRTWNEIPQLRHLADLVPIGSASRSQCNRLAHSGPIRRAPRGLCLSGLAAAAAAMLALFLVPGILTGPTQTYATQVAEMRQVTLPDGSLVTLGPKSKLIVKFQDGDRRVALSGGEAFFDVVHMATRPFTVEAGPSQVRVLGTKFDVNHGSNSIQVAVLEGAVEVHDLRAGAGEASRTRLLRARQRAELLMTSPAGASAREKAQMRASAVTTAGSWREGRLVYENVRLSDLVADVNRYYAPGVHLTDARVGEHRITASFKTSEIPAFISALPGVVPVRIAEKQSGSFLIDSVDR